MREGERGDVLSDNPNTRIQESRLHNKRLVVLCSFLFFFGKYDMHVEEGAFAFVVTHISDDSLLASI
jgi:hypothetical protein